MDWLLGGDGGVVEAWSPSLSMWATANPTLAAVVIWGMLAATLLVLATLFVAVRRRRLVCPERHVDADVDIEESGFPHFRRATAVLACSMFEPRTSVRCRRVCLAEERRRRA
jgi:hypothetical protein